MKNRGTRLASIRILSAIFLLLATAAQAATAGLHETDVTLSGGVLTITDDNGGSSNDNLTLSYAGGTYTLMDGGGLPIDVSTIAGSTGDGTSSVTFSDTGINSIIFNLLGGDDLVTITSVQPSFSGNFTITGGAGLDRATINANIATTGSGAINVTVSGNIVLNSGSSLTTVDGGITLDANAAGAQTADFIGLQANNAVIQTTGAGDIQLLGWGAETGGNSASMYGVNLQNSTTVSSTATGATAGKVIMNGTGGNSFVNSVGVALFGGTTVTSVDGDIDIVGMGGGNGTNQRNYGVRMLLDKIESTGTGTNAATITIIGTGGMGTNANSGVSIEGPSTDIISVEGNITIMGEGGPSTTNNVGISLSNFGKIESTGMGSNAATITLIGTGGNGTVGNAGVATVGLGLITSIDGDINIDGTGNGTGNSNMGVSLTQGDVRSTGTGADAAKITVTGTANGFSNGFGLSISGAEEITSVRGAVQLTGTGASGAGNNNHGVSIAPLLQVTDAPLTVFGTALGGNSYGTLLISRLVSDGSGNITLIGEGSGTFADFAILNGAVIGDGTHVGVTNPATGDITIRADTILMSGSSTSIESDGALTIEPRTPGTTISLGYWISGGGGTLDLTDVELGYLQDGFSSITIGRSDAGQITLETAIFKDPLVLLTAGKIDNNTSGPDISNNGNTTTFNGDLAPGSSPGTFRVTGDVAFANSSTFTAELTGATTTGSHDKLTATGSVTIGSNVSLNLDTSAYTTHQSGVITLIENGSGAVSGTFSGLPEGAQTNNGNSPNFIISYVGGDGNDVTLTAATATSITSVDMSATALTGPADLVLMILAGGLGVLSLLFVWWRRRSVNSS
ncbi:MAG: hypothetical protein AAF614_01725 [Chloroflexota bacterium]